LVSQLFAFKGLEFTGFGYLSYTKFEYVLPRYNNTFSKREFPVSKRISTN